MYLIDTDLLVFLLRGNAVVKEAFVAHESDAKAVSVISFGELLYGAYKSAKPVENETQVRRLLSLLPMCGISAAVMEIFSSIRAEMDKQGRRLDDFDMIIAATAIHLDCTLVTNNERHFRYVPGLVMENWAK